MERTGISLGAKLTYGKLVQFAGKRGWANPRRSVLAKQHGLSARQTDRYVAELEKVKLIRVQQLGLRKANRYYFLTHSWISFKRSRHMCLLLLKDPIENVLTHSFAKGLLAYSHPPNGPKQPPQASGPPQP